MSQEPTKLADALNSVRDKISEPVAKTVSATDIKTKIQSIKKTNEAGVANNDAFKNLLEKSRSQIVASLPYHLNPERVIQIIATEYERNERLRQCDPQSIIGAAIQAVQLGLEVNTAKGEAYIIPYFNNKKGRHEAQFQMGYKGVIQLCYNSGKFKTIQANTVYEDDFFEFEYGLSPKLVHRPNLKSDQSKNPAPVAYYAIYKLDNGGEDFKVWSTKQVEKHAEAYSKSYKDAYGPWQSDFNSMALKTVVLDVLKFAPKSSDLNSAISSDNTVKRELRVDMTASPDESEYIDV